MTYTKKTKDTSYMQLLEKKSSLSSRVEPFHCDFGNRIFLGNLGNRLLNAADNHSSYRGYGMSCLNTVNKTWVLSRLVIEMDSYPEAYDDITVDTWVDSVMRFFTGRNYAVRNTATGQVYGYGRSVWAMIDTVDRQPVDIMQIGDGLIMRYVDKDTPCPIEPFRRVRVDSGAECVMEFKARYSDVDVNGHFNSIKYLEHVMDIWDTSWHSVHMLRRIDVAYVAEARMGDTIRIYALRQDTGVYGVLVTRQAHGDSEQTEACRCRLTFVERR